MAIADNSDPQMHVAVYRTDNGSRVCGVPVFANDHSATENSLIVAGNTIVAENNDGSLPAVTSTTNGHSVTSGMVAVDVRGGRSCTLKWENDSIQVPSVVSKAILAGNLVITYTKPSNAFGLDAWYFTAVDLGTGRPVWTRLAGMGLPFNNHYASAYLGPGGDLFVGTVNGIVVLRS